MGFWGREDLGAFALIRGGVERLLAVDEREGTRMEVGHGLRVGRNVICVAEPVLPFRPPRSRPFEELGPQWLTTVSDRRPVQYH